MKKFIPHILVIFVFAAAMVLVFSGKKQKERILDERMSFRKTDKIPYGTFVAFRNLKYFFPNAAILDNRKEPGYWDSLSLLEPRQALLIISPNFFADESEMKKLISFAEAGNYVFISTRNVSSSVEDLIHSRIMPIQRDSFNINGKMIADSMNAQLKCPPFNDNTSFTYPGVTYHSWFSATDDLITEELGNGALFQTNFIHLRAGKGHFYLHLAPMAFTNYFLLHKNNIRYYENILSLIPSDISKVVWDEYYLRKRWFNEKEPRSNWLNVLFRYPPLRAALLTALFTLIVYVLFEMRRRQRFIPMMANPRNDSMDFVKTIGRLYYDKGDHLNLCRKMGAYFLEHVRNRYKLPTNNLNEEFIKNLQFRTGAEENNLRGIVSFIIYSNETNAVNEKQLGEFYKRLETFYKTA